MVFCFAKNAVLEDRKVWELDNGTQAGCGLTCSHSLDMTPHMPSVGGTGRMDPWVPALHGQGKGEWPSTSVLHHRWRFLALPVPPLCLPPNQPPSQHTPSSEPCNNTALYCRILMTHPQIVPLSSWANSCWDGNFKMRVGLFPHRGAQPGFKYNKIPEIRYPVT